MTIPRKLYALVAALVAFAGCVGAEDAPAEAAAVPAEAPALVPAETEVVFSWDGTLDIGACVPSNLNACWGTALPGESEIFVELEGAPLHGALTLTWASSGPHDEALELVAIEAQGRPGQWAGFPIAWASGPSPLVLEFEVEEPFDEDDKLILQVRADSVTPSPLYTTVESGTAFSVEGLVVLSA